MNPPIRRALTCCLALAALLAATAPPRVALAAAPLPADRLQFGVSSEPGDLGWMTGSGVPWRYRYQYLAGGVNTGHGWETWQDPAKPPGEFALDYMHQSAPSFIPVLTYYELLQSSPASGGDESSKDFSNLNNTATMHAYYTNFILLMQRAAAFGGQVVVHVEPDLWGYLQQRAAGHDASSLGASVQSSGVADVSGIPDTVQGFAGALLHLRDHYAPNVVMAVHASMWSSGIDVASNTDPSINVAALADRTAAFLGSAGLSSNPWGGTWDAVFNDVDDHDAGWWEAQGADNASFTHWWDASNTRFPNFARYLGWVAELHARSGRPQVVWQVPVGNQVYLTMNNTCGHYQDNVAEYFVAHAADLHAAGLVAVLFGAGNSCQTTNTDAMHDGVTNNNGKPTSDAAGGCNACNTRQATVSDDDGGFLRAAVAAYYAGVPIPGPKGGGGASGQPSAPASTITSQPAALAPGGAAAPPTAAPTPATTPQDDPAGLGPRMHSAPFLAPPGATPAPGAAARSSWTAQATMLLTAALAGASAIAAVWWRRRRPRALPVEPAT
jgi:hypothetical protein